MHNTRSVYIKVLYPDYIELDTDIRSRSRSTVGLLMVRKPKIKCHISYICIDSLMLERTIGKGVRSGSPQRGVLNDKLLAWTRGGKKYVCSTSLFCMSLNIHFPCLT